MRGKQEEEEEEEEEVLLARKPKKGRQCVTVFLSFLFSKNSWDVSVDKTKRVTEFKLQQETEAGDRTKDKNQTDAGINKQQVYSIDIL